MQSDYTTPLAQVKMDPLKAIMQLESSGGTNKAADTPNSYGALGDYQITPSFYKDVQKMNPDQFEDIPFQKAATDPNISREVVDHGLDMIAKQLKSMKVDPNLDNVILAYHSGIGNVKKGNIGPQGKKYLEDFKNLTGL